MKTYRLRAVYKIPTGLLLLSLSACCTLPQTPATNTTVTTSTQTPIKHFKAYGFSPAWQAEIHGDSLSYTVPETASVTNTPRTIRTARLAYAKGVNYNGTDAGIEITLDIRTGTCSTVTVKDKPSQLIATLHYGNTIYKGCADAVQQTR